MARLKFRHHAAHILNRFGADACLDLGDRGAGYSKAEALAAVGAKVDVVVTCHEDGLAWTVSAGDGGNQWEQAEPLTFYWQSTLPPAGPEEAYAIFANYTAAQGPGPYPAADTGAANACESPAERGS